MWVLVSVLYASALYVYPRDCLLHADSVRRASALSFLTAEVPEAAGRQEAPPCSPPSSFNLAQTAARPSQGRSLIHSYF